MDEATTRLRALRDDRLPLLPAMLGEPAGELLDALAATAGGQIESFRAGQVNWQPGHSLVVRYDALVRWPNAETPAPESLVVTTGGELPERELRLQGHGGELAAWRLPNDPALPGLATLMDPAGARMLLNTVGAPEGPATPHIRAYRPGRRAVVQLTGANFEAYVKVVRPHRVAQLQDAHAAAAARLPVPRSFGWAPEHGIVVLEALPGITLRQALGSDSAMLPAPGSVDALLEAIPAPADARLAPDPVAVATSHARMLARLLPDQRWRLDSLLSAFRPLPADEPLVPVHGDLYEAQLMTDGAGALTGMLDIDTIGLGHRINDYANFLGHLATWEGGSSQPARVRDYARALLAHADDRADPVALRERIAAVILGLATGPFRVQQHDWPAETRRRLALAAQWAASAQRISSQRRRVTVPAR